MKLYKLIFTNSDCYKEGVAKKQYIKPIGIMWHSTGANNPNLSRYVGPDDGKLGKNPYNNHWNQPRDRRVCPHAWIGKLADGTIATYQCLPWDLRGWHSGSGKNGNANSQGYIGFEICEDSTNNKDYALAVYKEAVELSAYLCQMFKLNPLKGDVIIDHAEGHRLGIASNHGDVRHWLGKYGITLKKMREDIDVELKKLNGGQTEPTKPDNGVPYIVKLEKGTKIYEKANDSKVVGVIDITTNYTIIQESGNYGKLKSGIGWVKLKDEPDNNQTSGIIKKVETWANNNKLKNGNRDKLVEVLQAGLIIKGFDVGDIDGVFGVKTEAQVKEYQKKNKLAVDGVVGSETWHHLLK